MLTRIIKSFGIIALITVLAIRTDAAIAQTQADKPLQVIATFSILADITRQVGGDTVEVRSLVGENTDAHSWSPTPDDVKTVKTADVIIINGLGFEGWITRLIEASGFKGQIVTASDGIVPRIISDTHHGNSGYDPHAWQNPANGRIYAHNIAEALATASPTYATRIRQRAAAYDTQLAATDASINRLFADLPVDKRKVVTTHDAFGYFGDAYSITFLSAMGLSNDSEPSAATIAALLKQIKHDNVRAIFIENLSDPRLMRQIAKDSDVTFGGKLYSDALSPATEAAPSYTALLLTNAQRLREAMGK